MESAEWRYDSDSDAGSEKSNLDSIITQAETEYERDEMYVPKVQPEFLGLESWFVDLYNFVTGHITKVIN